MIGHDDDPGALRRRHERVEFAERERDRLLEQHVAAGLDGLERERDMEVVRA